MERDERLENLSDLVRRGHPISFEEALEVIGYQEKLKSERKKISGFGKFIGKIFNFKSK